MIFFQIFILAAGFAFLVKGADFFVDGASAIAKAFHIPSIVIGLTIVSFGTSLPELAVSVTSAIQGVEGIAIGNVVGSNIVNLMLVAGCAAAISPMEMGKSLMKKDFPFSILITAALFLMFADKFFDPEATRNIISRADGIMLLLFFVIFMYSTVSYSLANQTEETCQNPEEKKSPVAKSILVTAAGLAGVIAGGQMVVKSATYIAKAAGMSDTLIGLTVVAFGTSLPELVTSIIAAKKGENDIAMGNVIGSNIFNILFILGVSATIRPLALDSACIFDTVILIAFSALVWLMARPKYRLNRACGIAMILLYAAYDAFVFLR